MNLKTEAISIEMLNKVHFTLRGEYIVFKDSLIRKKLRLSNSIKSGEEKYADKTDKTLMARKMWKEAVSMIIIKLQAYKHNLQIQRTQQCKQRLDRMLPNIDCKDIEEDDKIFGESYDSEESSNGTVSEHTSEIGIKEYGSEVDGGSRAVLQPFNAALDAPQPFDPSLDAPPGSDLDKPTVGVGILGKTKLGANGTATAAQRKSRSASMSMQEIDQSGDCFESRYQKHEQDEIFNKTYEQYIDHPPAQQLPPSHIYEIIMRTFYRGENKIEWPDTMGKRIVYICLIPLTHLQYISIPNPMRGKNGERENLYPITLFMSLIWIWIYAFIIVWFTFDVTLGFGMKNFNVLPMIIYPFGIALRDYKKKVNLEQAIKTFRV